MTDRLAVFGEPVDERALAQIENCMKDERAVAGALMADHHLGYSMPIGGVVVYDGAISPSGVGFDIACGNKCVETNLLLADVLAMEASDEDATPAEQQVRAVKPILREIQRRVEFGMGRSNPTPVEHELFDEHINPVWLDLQRYSPGLKQKARNQLGTVGSGNHYVDLLVDEAGKLWIANHFGSRGLGHTIATGFLNFAAGREFGEPAKDEERPTVLDVNASLGETYVAAMQLAGEYAYAGRDYVIEQVLAILGASAVREVHNHHNYAWQSGSEWIVRKGATPLTTEPAFIGGSMGDESVIVRWTGADIGALGSAPHGAGRQMSRTRARGKIKRRTVYACTNRDCDFMVAAKDYRGEPCPRHPEAKVKKWRREEIVSKGEIDWDATRAGLLGRGIVVLGAGADEAPGAYKRLLQVIAQHPNIEIEHTLQPVGVVMAGPDTFDPYKD